MQPEIFKLTVDCFNELFDYLSLEDLCSFGGTCRLIQKFAGDYFKRNYSSAKKITDNKGIVIIYIDSVKSHRIAAPILNPFIASITHRTDKIQSLRYIDMHSDEFSSLVEIHFMCIALNVSKINCLQQILPKIEVIKLTQCSIEGDIYMQILCYCTNLKEIHVDDEGNRLILNESTNPWLLQRYSFLETLHLTQSKPFKINELCEFFQKNPNVRTFSTSSWCVARNGKEFIESNIKLINLKVFEGYNGTPMNMQILCLLLNKLHEQGFYKFLHVKFSLLSQEHCDQMVSLCALDSLYVTLLMDACDLSRLTSLKELTLSEGIHMQSLAKNLVNLKRLSIYNAKYVDILSFVSISVKLKEIEAHFKRGETIDLFELNEQRKCLTDTNKVVIFVQEDIYLKSKWTSNGKLNLHLIELRRFGS